MPEKMLKLSVSISRKFWIPEVNPVDPQKPFLKEPPYAFGYGKAKLDIQKQVSGIEHKTKTEQRVLTFGQHIVKTETISTSVPVPNVADQTNGVQMPQQKVRATNFKSNAALMNGGTKSKKTVVKRIFL